jgi:phosphoglycolate phosphatase-like HAD superfamily hydrolase
MPDYGIAVEALRTVGDPAEEATVHELLRVHGEQLPDYLPLKQGRVMPGVREALESLAARDDVLNLLLTGNTEAGARAKLEHYGLGEFFAAGGAFCVGPGDRAEIAVRALPMANGADAYVIGDTPADIACGKGIGARTIAVATGAFSAEQLAEHEPWVVLERIPEPDALYALLGLVPT